MIEFLKKHIIYVAFVVVVLGIIFVSNSLRSVSDTSAKYLSRADATDTARVAKWNITKIGASNGAYLDLTATFGKQLESETSGTWFLEVNNASEVTAKLNAASSVIKMRLDSKEFDGTSPSTIEWSSFSAELLLKFKIDVYYSNYADLVFYRLIESPYTEIDVDAYSALSTSEKAAYEEVINPLKVSTKQALYETTLTQTFTRHSEIQQGAPVYYYETTIDTSSLVDVILNMSSSSSDSAVTFVLSWEVGALGGINAGAGAGNFTIYTVNYSGDTPTGITETTVDFFHYTTYLSSIGGQASFEFDGSYIGSKYVVFYEYLTAPQKAQIEGYKDAYEALNPDLDNPTDHSMDDKYAQYLLLKQYEEYLAENESIYADQKYSGLKCSFNFMIRVEQVD